MLIARILVVMFVATFPISADGINDLIVLSDGRTVFFRAKTDRHRGFCGGYSKRVKTAPPLCRRTRDWWIPMPPAPYKPLLP